MKTLLRSISMLALVCLFQQCNDTSPEPNSAYRDLKTTAQAKKHPLTLSAIITEFQSTPPNSFQVYVWGTRGEINVDWGDGTSSTYQLGESLSLQKIYDAPGRYEISITGDLKNITHFHSSYGEGVFDSVNLSSLTGLEGIRIGLTKGPHTFDFSSNKRLTELNLTAIEELTQVLLPKKHSLSNVSIAGPNSLSTEMVDYVISGVYENAVKHRIYNGYFNVSELYYEDPEYYKNLVGPPSHESVSALRVLQNRYGWEIVPMLSD